MSTRLHDRYEAVIQHIKRVGVVPAPIRERFRLGPSTRLEWLVALLRGTISGQAHVLACFMSRMEVLIASGKTKTNGVRVSPMPGLPPPRGREGRCWCTRILTEFQAISSLPQEWLSCGQGGFLQDRSRFKATACSLMKPTAPPLPPLLQAKLEPLRALCERYGVERLELFGSAARGEFDPTSSDLDFIVQMKGRREPGYARRFYEFAEAIEELYGCRVDLLTDLMIKNPYFKAEVETDRRVLLEI
jgi:predicted nucleotidyltransferase